MITGSIDHHRIRLAKAIEESNSSKSAVLEILQGALVAPLTYLNPGAAGKMGVFDGGAYYEDGSICQRSLHIKNGFQNHPLPISSEVEAEFIPGRHIFGGLLKNEHFGHFLAESLARLWALDYVGNDVHSLVYYVRDKDRNIPSFIEAVLSEINNRIRVRIISKLTRFETLLVPDQLVHPVIGFIYGHKAVKKQFSNLRKEKIDQNLNVYISRSNLSHHEGGILCEKILENNLAKENYKIIHPQELSIKEQLSIYLSASKLIFAEGSALHLYALVAQPDQKLYMIRRRQLGIVFDWQVATFGGPIVEGTPCIKKLYIPEKDGASMMRVKALLDFNRIRDELFNLGFIQGNEWQIPREKDFDSELIQAESSLKQKFLEHIPA